MDIRRRRKAVFVLGLLCGVVWSAAIPSTQTLPVVAYPRPGAIKLLENERVIIWRVTFKKGEPTPLHKHIYDKVTVFLQDTTIEDTTVDGKHETWDAKAGDTYYSRKGTVHIEEGQNDTPRDVVVVELK